MSYIQNGGTGGGGAGTVTNTGGALTANAIVLGAGGNDEKVVAGLTTDGTAGINVGATGVGGTVTLFGGTSGSNTLTAPGNGTQLTLTALTIQLAGASGSLNATNALSVVSNGATVTVKGGQSSAINTAQLDFLPTNSSSATSGTQVGTMARGTFAPASGTSNFHGLISNPTINQTGGANGTIRALASYPVNTALVGTEYLIAAGTSSATGPTGTLTDLFLVDSNGLTKGKNTVFVAANFTTSGVGTALEAITGLTINTQPVATNWNFHAHLSYSQAVGAAAVAFGIQVVTNAPTNVFANGTQQITAGPPATFVTGTLATLTTTTATTIVSGTPGATGVNYVVDLHGTCELPASANTVRLSVSTAAAADLVTVLRGSYFSFTA